MNFPLRSGCTLRATVQNDPRSIDRDLSATNDAAAGEHVVEIRGVDVGYLHARAFPERRIERALELTTCGGVEQPRGNDDQDRALASSHEGAEVIRAWTDHFTRRVVASGEELRTGAPQ